MSAVIDFVNQHRSAFRAGTQWADTEPEQPKAAECCCGEFLVDPSNDVRGPMQALTGLICTVAILAAAALAVFG